MPFDQYRTVVAALDRLTTQVGRVADTMPTPVDDYDDDGPTTDDDALRDRIHTALTTEHYRRARERIEASPDEHCAGFTNVVMPIVQPLAAELARIRRALDPDDEVYIRETVDDMFALQAKVDEATTILRRIRALHRRETVQTTGGSTDVCVSCESDGTDYPWPCPTAEALSPAETER
jgi:hypothetical protein